MCRADAGRAVARAVRTGGTAEPRERGRATGRSGERASRDLDPPAARRAVAGRRPGAGRAPARRRRAAVAGAELRREGQHRRGGIAHHGRLSGLQLRAEAERAGGAAAAGRRRAAGGKDQPGPVRHRSGGRALALRRAGQPVRRRDTSSGGPARDRRRPCPAAWWTSRWGPTPPVRGGCRLHSPTWSAGSRARACCPPGGWCRPADRWTACRCSRRRWRRPGEWPR